MAGSLLISNPYLTCSAVGVSYGDSITTKNTQSLATEPIKLIVICKDFVEEFTSTDFKLFTLFIIALAFNAWGELLENESNSYPCGKRPLKLSKHSAHVSLFLNFITYFGNDKRCPLLSAESLATISHSYNSV